MSNETTPVEDTEQVARREAREQTEVSRLDFLEEADTHSVFKGEIDHEGYDGTDSRIPDPRNAQ